MHTQIQELIMQRLQGQAEPVLVSGNQAPLVRSSCQAQPRLAGMRIQQNRNLPQASCMCAASGELQSTLHWTGNADLEALTLPQSAIIKQDPA